LNIFTIKTATILISNFIPRIRTHYRQNSRSFKNYRHKWSRVRKSQL